MAALGKRAAWLLDDDQPGDMAAARHRLFERVLALLADLADQAPLVLVLEDLHWADESSHELLAFLAVRLGELRSWWSRRCGMRTSRRKPRGSAVCPGKSAQAALAGREAGWVSRR